MHYCTNSSDCPLPRCSLASLIHFDSPSALWQKGRNKPGTSVIQQANSRWSLLAIHKSRSLITSDIGWHKKVITYIYKDPEVLQINTCLSNKTCPFFFLNRHYNALSADIQNSWADFSIMIFLCVWRNFSGWEVNKKKEGRMLKTNMVIGTFNKGCWFILE